MCVLSFINGRGTIVKLFLDIDHTKLANMSVDEIFDLKAGVYVFHFCNKNFSYLMSFLSTRAYHYVETTVDAHCVRDEGGFTL